MNTKNNTVKYLHGEVLNLFSQLWVCSGWCYWVSVLWMIRTLPCYNVNRTIQPGFLLPGNTNYPPSQYLQSSSWDVCHIYLFVMICYGISTDGTNCVRAFSLPLGQLQQGLSWFLLSRCALGTPAGSWQRGLCSVMLDGPKTSCKEMNKWTVGAENCSKNWALMGFRWWRRYKSLELSSCQRPPNQLLLHQRMVETEVMSGSHLCLSSLLKVQMSLSGERISSFHSWTMINIPLIVTDSTIFTGTSSSPTYHPA